MNIILLAAESDEKSHNVIKILTEIFSKTL